jgi:two-component system sensor histidine kinase MprB
MDNAGCTGDEARSLPELVARSLRHEVGDFLQSVYATGALLQSRLPPAASLERQLVTDLRSRAEEVKHVLDGVYSLVIDASPANGTIADLAAAARDAVAAVSRKAIARVDLDALGPLPVWANGRLLTQTGTLLLLAACRSAHQEVRFRAGPAAAGEAEWVLTHDGAAPSPEQLQWLDRPFASTHNLAQGLGLALARQVAERHGGRIELADPAEAHFRFRLVLPLAA